MLTGKQFLREEEKLKELRRYCKDHLAYIIDEGYEVRVDYANSIKNSLLNSKSRYIITIDNITENGFKPFTFEEISDSLIPFIYQLNKDYDIKGDIHFNLNKMIDGTFDEYYRIDSVIEGDIIVDGICDIEIEIGIIRKHD
jgi:hypothetical protein